MAVPEQHHVTPLVLGAMPGQVRGRINPRVFPDPVALDNLGAGLDGDFRAFDGSAPGLVRNFFDTPWLDGPLRTIAVAVFQETVLGSEIRVPFV